MTKNMASVYLFRAALYKPYRVLHTDALFHLLSWSLSHENFDGHNKLCSLVS